MTVDEALQQLRETGRAMGAVDTLAQFVGAHREHVDAHDEAVKAKHEEANAPAVAAVAATTVAVLDRLGVPALQLTPPGEGTADQVVKVGPVDPAALGLASFQSAQSQAEAALGHVADDTKTEQDPTAPSGTAAHPQA